jgi:hypothetical protein
MISKNIEEIKSTSISQLTNNILKQLINDNLEIKSSILQKNTRLVHGNTELPSIV